MGRVGGLAVALGVGAAVSIGCTSAWADDAGNTSGPGGSAADKPAGSSADTGEQAGTSNSTPSGAAGSPDDPAAPPSQTTSSTHTSTGSTASPVDSGDDSENPDTDAGPDAESTDSDDASSDSSVSPTPTQAPADSTHHSAGSATPTEDTVGHESVRPQIADTPTPTATTPGSTTDTDSQLPDEASEPRVISIQDSGFAPAGAESSDVVSSTSAGPVLTDAVASATDPGTVPAITTDSLAAVVVAALLGGIAPGNVPTNSPAELIALAATRRDQDDSDADQTLITTPDTTSQITDSVAVQAFTLSVASPFSAAPDPVTTSIDEAIKNIGNVIGGATIILRDAIVHTLDFISEAVKAASTFGKWLVDATVSGLHAVIDTTTALINGSITFAVNVVADAFRLLPNPLGDTIAGTVQFFGTVVTTAIDVVSDAIDNIVTFSGAVLDTAITVLSDLTVGAINVISVAKYELLTAIAGFFTSNAAPIATDDTATTNEDAPVVIRVLANDTDPDGDTLVLGAYTQGAHGAVTVNPDGTLTYTPNADYNGTDTFTYTVTSANLSDIGTVTVTITPVNDAPVATDDTATTNEHTHLVLAPNILLANDTDPDHDTLTITAVGTPTHGTTTKTTDGTCRNPICPIKF